MNWPRWYLDHSFAAGSVISYDRSCENRVCMGGPAESTVHPGLRRANTCTHRVRRSLISTHVHSGAMTGFMRIGTRICGARTGSIPEKPSADTPTMVIG